MKTNPIEVDGERPVASWVTSLPSGWTRNAGERLVLLLLALDAYEDTSTPGIDNLTQWTGLARQTVFEHLASLTAPVERRGVLFRPALVERVDGKGEIVVSNTDSKNRKTYRRGRRRASYRLRVEIDPGSWSPEQSAGVDCSPTQQSGHESTPADCSPRQQSDHESGHESGQESGPPDPPFPPLPSSGSSSTEPPEGEGRQRARAEHQRGSARFHGVGGDDDA